MVKLRTLKNANALRKYTELRPKLICKTRWSGAFNMVERFFELVEPIKKLIESEFDETLQLPKKSALENIKGLFDKMKDFNSVMLKLQESNITLLDVRKLFDFTINSYPTMKNYLGSRAEIVFSPDFEAAVVRMLQKVCVSKFYIILILNLFL